MWEIGFDPRVVIDVDGGSRACTFRHGAACAAKQAECCGGLRTGSLLTPASAELERAGAQEMIVLVGSPAAGKSTFAKRHLASYQRISQDDLGSLAKCKHQCAAALRDKKSVVIDSTNRNRAVRGGWVALAQEKVRCPCSRTRCAGSQEG